MKQIIYYTVAICFIFFLCQKEGTAQNIEFCIQSDLDISLVQVHKIQDGTQNLIEKFALKAGEEKNVVDSSVQAFYLVKYQNQYRKIFAQEGQKIGLKITSEGFVDIKPSKENILLNDWHDMSNRARLLSAEYYYGDMDEVNRITPFYKAQRELEKESISFLKKLSRGKGSAYFKNALKALVKAEINFFKLYHRQIPIIAASIKELPDDLYEPIFSTERLDNPAVLDVFEYIVPYISLYGDWHHLKDESNRKPDVEYVKSPEIQVAYLIFMGKIENDGSGLKTIENKYMHLFQSGYALKQLEQLRNSFAERNSKEKFKTIVLKNTNGEIVNISDYTGKLLVIDVWATWCGPCMKMRPVFKQLAHEMADKDVTFLAISTDKNEKSWKDVAEKSEGVELFDHTQIFKMTYGVGSIPQFLIFDAEGNLLEASAPHPLNGALRRKIEGYLSK